MTSMIGSFPMLNTQEIILQFKKQRRKKVRLSIMKCFKTFLILMVIVRRRTLKRLLLRESMKQSVVFLLMKTKKPKSITNLLRNSLFSLDTLTKELSEKTQKKLPKRKKIKRKDFNQQRDLSLLKRRRLTWQAWTLSIWCKA